MRHRPLIALILTATLVPLIAQAQTAIRRLPGQKGIIVQGGREAIGPKQDDPLAVDCGPSGAATGQAMPGKPGGENDPKAHAGTGTLAIGPKQDDPSSRGLIVQGGREAIGPKQDDPSTRGIIVQNGREAIGPKQDDPRAATAVQHRPGDDNDPKARCSPAAAAGAR